MMNDETERLLEHLKDLERRRDVRGIHTESGFLNEEEQAQAIVRFPPSDMIRYVGGYPDARKKKVIFPRDLEDDFSDIVFIAADVDLRFRKIGHRDILGSLMALQIDRHSIGDLFLDEQLSLAVIYTGSEMARFLIDNYHSIANLNVSFREVDPIIPERRQEEIIVNVAALRMDCVTAALAHTSRENAKEMIRQGKVMVNHRLLEKADSLCNNNCTISIRGIGRFTYVSEHGRTRKNRVTALFLKEL